MSERVDRRRDTSRTGLRAVLAVAATYVYFLLFAQYGFLRLARRNLDLGSDADLRPALAAMGVCGLLTSIAVGRMLARRSPRALLQTGFAIAAGVAVAGLGLHSEALFVVAGAAIGVAIALITVPLATWLPDLVPAAGNGHAERLPLGLTVGLGTGAAYLLCNVPAIFEGAPGLQVAVSASAALSGLVAVRGLPDPRVGPAEPGAPSVVGLSTRDARGLGFVAVVASFLALVWLDSAAFAVIQETAPLKAPTWGSAAQQLSMGATHLLAAVAAGWAIDRGVFRGLLLSAFGLFAVAFTTLTGLAQAAPTVIAAAGPIYAIGISFYSVALVAYPGLIGEAAGTVPRRWRAATLYGVAGWLGSALGVGMAQNLHTIPRPFLWGAGVLLTAAWVLSKTASARALREAATAALPLVAIAGTALAAALLLGAGDPTRPAANDDAIARGRAVYVAEGCINCHSQYVRPGSADLERWGPFRPLDRDEPGPVLIGNRRQGPDLTNVGTRRSPTWQRLHLIDPRSVSPGSRMPSYAHLFRDARARDDQRGADLVAYLDSLGAEQREERFLEVQAYDLSDGLPAGDPGRGEATFVRYCSACHGVEAHGDGRLADRLDGRALDLHKPGFWLVTWSADGGEAALEEGLTKLVRWGMPGSDMPGHETLPDQDVADLVSYVLSLQDGRPLALADAGR